MSGTVAALYVDERPGGSYVGLPGVDAWGINRDARLYEGPHPIVAHPPCQRWGKLWAGSPIHIKRTGERKVLGDDQGCFKAALVAVRRWGGIIEHPWLSRAWPHHDLNTPPRAGGWIVADFYGGWTCCVEQGRYGHYARKPTLLYVAGIDPTDLPELDWGIGESRLDPAVVERMGRARAIKLGEVGARGGGTDSAPRIGTPEPFRDLLLSIARTAQRLAA